MSKEKIKILRLIESVRYTANDIYKVADEIMEMQKAYADEVNKEKYTKDEAIELIVGYASYNFGVAKDIIRLGVRSYVESQTLKQIDHE